MASLMVYKNQINKATATQADTDVVLQLPKLSDVPQDEQQGFIADISAAIAKHEDTDGSKDQEGNTKPKASCILPKTTFEFERSTQLAKIKAIRGLSPNKDIEVKLSDKSCSLLATKVNFDFRFKAIDRSMSSARVLTVVSSSSIFVMRSDFSYFFCLISSCTPCAPWSYSCLCCPRRLHTDAAERLHGATTSPKRTKQSQQTPEPIWHLKLNSSTCSALQ